MLKKLLPHIIAIAVFYLAILVFFYPETQGKKIVQSDMVAFQSMRAEVQDYKAETGETTYWNGGMFSGMPWEMLSYGAQNNALRYVVIPLKKLGLGNNGSRLFVGAVLSYLTLVLLGINAWLSIIVIIGFIMNTYNMVLLEAGHVTKINVIGNGVMILAGTLAAFRGKYLIGGLLFSVGCGLALVGNHIQMLYYIVLLTVAFYLVYFIVGLVQKNIRWNDIWKPIGVLVVGGLLAIGANSSQIYSSQTFGEETMRGAPILVNVETQETASSSSKVDGLDWDYVTQWSHDWKDIMSILIPRFAGGGSAEAIDANSEMGRLMRNNGAPATRDGKIKAPMYWGDMPFTSGPAYFGAALLFLLLFSLLILPASIRWGGVAALLTVVTISYGDNAAWLVRPLYDYFPLFNKFRAHNSMIAVFPVVSAVLVALGLQQILEQKDKNSLLRPLYIAGGTLGGLCLLVYLLGPGSFSFLTASEQAYGPQIQQIFIAQRQDMLQADALRSFGFIALAAILLFLYFKKYIKRQEVLWLGLVLVLVLDIFPVNKRYLDAGDFVTANNYEQNFAPRPVDQQIFQMEPQGRGYYRVLDLSINTFNSAQASNSHNTIGGYFPAKLQRYQDIIDFHIAKNNQRVLDMLNTKYVINQQQELNVNQNALGNAWFVNDLMTVGTSYEEINALNTIDPGNTAVFLAKDFSEQIGQVKAGNGQGTITLTSYAPGSLVYQSNSNSEQLAVFSEVWYGKGWTMKIDGELSDFFRLNYVLRGAMIPAGGHEISFEFKPPLPLGLKIATILSSWLLFLGFLAMLCYLGWRLWQRAQAEPPKAKAKSTTKKKPAQKKSTKGKKKPGRK